MAKWKQAPEAEAVASVAETADGGTGAVTLDSAVWGMDGFAYLTVAGIDIPTAALVLPLPVVALYLVFRGLSRKRDRADPRYMPEAPDMMIGRAGRPSGSP